jgi:hypothetical protein
MTGKLPVRQAHPASGWRGAVPEIVIAMVLVVALSIAGYALAGSAAPGAVAIGTAVIALVTFRGMLPPEQASSPHRPEMPASQAQASFTGFWRKRAGLVDGTRSAAAFDAGLRPTLQHLLAARLAERHGVSLRDDPDQARRLFCQGDRDDWLWYWVDPARPAIQGSEVSTRPTSQSGGRRGRRRRGQAGSQQGIPPRTLARLIDRLERL